MKTGHSRDGGIYEIVSPSGKRYIGSSAIFRSRWSQHRAKLRKGDHHCAALQYAWKKYGESALVFRIIEVIGEPTRERLIEREQFYIDTLSPEYNVLRIAGSALGYKHSDETKRKARPDLTKCKKMLHDWIEGATTCLACHNEKRAKWAADHPDEHRRHRRESAQRKLDAEKPERVRKSPAGTRKPCESRASGLCRNGLHPKDPAGCRPCRLETQRKWNAKRPTKTARRRGVRTYRAASPVQKGKHGNRSLAV